MISGVTTRDQIHLWRVLEFDLQADLFNHIGQFRVDTIVVVANHVGFELTMVD